MTTQPERRKRPRWGRRAMWALVALLLALGLANYLGGGGVVPRTSARVALLRIEGPILSAGRTVRRIERYGKDPSIRALVVLVNSPGGGVAASQEIYHALLRYREGGKPVVTSMEAVAASGGYYVALASDKIFANAGTITGSIGVVFQLSNVEGLLKKVGLRFEVMKSGAHKDLGSPLRPLSPEDRKIIQRVIDDVHGQFKRAVSRERKLSPEEVQKIADGRIFSGERAKALGLVDEVGTLRDAVNEAARLAGIPGPPEVYEERRLRGWVQRLLREFWPAGWTTDRLSGVGGLHYLWTY
ncbi:MAG: signal peptide peptidase SppA [Nitrospinota bacterium]